MGKLQCDDGNTIDGDGCSSKCAKEFFWFCSGGSAISPDVCSLSVRTMTLTQCEAVAAMFDNTCDVPDGSDLDHIVADDSTCDSVGFCPLTGMLTGMNTCTWGRKLCVSCSRILGITRIRVQTNSLPNHCYKAPSQAPSENAIDFEVAFGTDIYGLPPVDPGTQKQIDDALCNNQWPAALPFLYNETTPSNNSRQLVGVSLTGVPIFSGASEYNLDAIRPNTTDSIKKEGVVVD